MGLPRKAKKPVGGVLIIFLLVVLITGVCYLLFYFNKDQIKQALLAQVFELQKGEVSIGDIHLSLFSHLSGVTIQVDDVQFYEHSPEKRPEGTPPIVDAKSLLVSFHPWELFNGKLDVQEAELMDGRVNLVFYNDNTFNVLRAIGIQPKKIDTSTLNAVAQQPFELALGLDAIKLKNLDVAIEHDRADLLVHVRALDVDAVFSYTRPLHEVLCAGDFQVKGLSKDGKPYPKPKNLSIDVDFWIDEQSQNGRINPSTIQLGGLDLDLNADFNISADSAFIDAIFDASTQDWNLLSLLVQEDILYANPDIWDRGDIYLRGKIVVGQGPLDASMEFGAQDISLKSPDGLVRVSDRGFKGKFSSGDSADLSLAVIEVKDLKADLPGGGLSSSFRFENFTRPKIEFLCDLDADITGYHQIFKLGILDSIVGHVEIRSDLQVEFSNDPDQSIVHSGTLEMDMNNLSFWIHSLGRKIDHFSGRILKSDSVLRFEALKLETNGSDLTLESQVTNVIPFLLNEQARIIVEVNARSDALRMNDFFESNLPYFEEVSDVDLGLRWITAVDYVHEYDVLPSGTLLVQNLQARATGIPAIQSLTLDIDMEEDSIGSRLIMKHLSLNSSAGSIELAESSIELNEAGIKLELTGSGSEIELDDFQNLMPDSAPSLLSQGTINEIDLNLIGTVDTTDYQDLPRGNLEVEHFFLDLQHGPDIEALEGRIEISGDTAETLIRIEELVVESSLGSLQLDQALVRVDQDEIRVESDLLAGDVKLSQLMRALELQDSVGLEGDRVDDLIGLDLDFSGGWTLGDSTLRDLSMSGRQIRYSFSDSGHIEAQNLNLDIDELAFGDPTDSLIFAGIKTVEGGLEIQSWSGRVFKDLALKLEVEGIDSHYQMDFSLDELPGTEETGQIVIDYRQGYPTYSVRYTANDFPTEHVMKKFYGEEILTGKLNLNIDLTTGGWDYENLFNYATGRLDLAGDSITLYGADLDLFLKRYKKSQNFNLTDVTAFMLIGPFGAVVTKGTDFVKVMNIPLSPDETTSIPKLLSLWEFDSGMVRTKDVGFITTQNRLVVSGQINMLKDSIERMQVAVVDSKGCSLMDQEVWGKYNDIQLGELNVVGTVLGAVSNALKLVAGNSCEPVYAGALQHPEKQ